LWHDTGFQETLSSKNICIWECIWLRSFQPSLPSLEILLKASLSWKPKLPRLLWRYSLSNLIKFKLRLDDYHPSSIPEKRVHSSFDIISQRVWNKKSIHTVRWNSLSNRFDYNFFTCLSKWFFTPWLTFFHILSLT